MIVAADRLQIALDAHLAGDLRKAEGLYKKILQTLPGSARACWLLGSLYAQRKQINLAIAMLRRAVALDPNLAEAHNNLGSVLEDAGDIPAAEQSYARAFTLAPANPDFAGNLAALREAQGDSETALALYDNIIAQIPSHADARWNRSLILLRGGEFAGGWSDFEWRFAATGSSEREFAAPRWRGETLAGKTIFVHAEQGYGDTFHFVRYLPWLQSQGAHVVFECHDGMKSVLENCDGFALLTEWSEHWIEQHGGEVDYQVPLLSLPGLARTSLKTIFAKNSYVKARQDKEQYWGERLSSIPKGLLRVGVVWAGSPNQKNDINRSCRLQDLAPLLEMDGVQIVSLQRGPAASQIASYSGDANIIDLSNEIADFADTAGVIANLDLVISVCTSVAHLAGAMGRPVWTLLSKSACWRWMQNRDDSPWYPTMRLFRQEILGNWAHPVQSAARVLAGERPKHSPKVEKDRSIMNKDAERLFRAGEEKFQKGDFGGAEQCYDLALKHDASHVMALCQLGSIHMGRGDYAGAEPFFERALSLNPEMAGPHNNFGVVLKELKRFDEAQRHYQEAIRIDPKMAEAYSNLAVVQLFEDDFEAARTNLYQAIELRPDYYPAYWNLASLLSLEGRIDAAMQTYDAILRLMPEHADAHANRALLLLTQGDFERGWPEHEWRFAAHPNLIRPPHAPRWQGEPLGNKTILARAEQGLGDTFQFVRYLPWLKSLGASVVLECQVGLGAVLTRANVADRVIERSPEGNAALPPCDFEVPLLSLPMMAGTDLQTIPAMAPYLSADPTRAAHWRGVLDLDHNGGLKIGIVWAGSPEHQNDAARSSSLQAFAPLLQLPNVTLFSLQMGASASQLDQIPTEANVVDLGSRIQNFEDTAAVVENLDLVISVDTSVAHLAAAMGKPVWVLLALVPDWRWLLERSDTPWYPTMRLFRQSRRGDWNALLRDVAAEAARLASPTQSIDEQLTQIESIVAIGDLEEAHVHLMEATRLAPNDVRVLNMLGVVCWSRGMPEEALRSFMTALELDPTNRDTILNCADVALAFGQNADAEALCQSYLASHPDDAEVAALLAEMRKNGVSNAA
ncbi:MAG: tetratricopeptide repeat protein [Capsulimonas sp.]|uniref:tetratricopeptide repeat protein n=1 Tax=Capsulimonas sp. TaxID=2494211 RepID=UPI0032670B5B